MTRSPCGLLMQYQYDALDRVVSSVPAETHQQHRFYQNDEVATLMQGETCQQFLRGMGMFLAVLQEGDASRTSLLMTDKPGSVLQCGEHKLAYTPYGYCPEEKQAVSRLGFNGECCEMSTGHYLLGNGHRAFNPVLMRFNSSDALSPFGKGGLNCYAYCGGDPVNRIDPTGRWYGAAWFANAATGFAVDYLVPLVPKPVARLIPGAANRTFGEVASAMATVTGFLGSVVYLAMNRIEEAHPDSPVNDPIFYAYLTIGAIGALSGAGLALHKSARRSLRAQPPAPRQVRAMSLPATGRTSPAAQQSAQPLQLPDARLTRSQSQPDLHHGFGSSVPKPRPNTNLDRFNLRLRFDQGLYRPSSSATDNAISIRRRS